MSAQWYIMLNGMEKGPVSTADLQKMVEQGQIQSHDEVWRVGTPDWMPVSRALPVKPASQAAAPGALQSVRAGAPATPNSHNTLVGDVADVIGLWARHQPAVELRNGRLGIICGMFFCAIFLGLGSWMLTWATPRHLAPFLFAVILLGVGILGLLIGLVRLADRSVKLVLDSEGICDPSAQPRGVVRWTDIRSARLSQWKRNGSVTDAVVTVSVLDAGSDSAKDLAYRVDGLDRCPEDIYQEIVWRAGLM